MKITLLIFLFFLFTAPAPQLESHKLFLPVIYSDCPEGGFRSNGHCVIIGDPITP